MKNIVIKGWMVAVTVFVVMFGGILLTMGTGHWSTSRKKEPVKFESGEYKPSDIRGSYAFSEIEQFYNVPVDVLYQAFMIPEEQRQPGFQIKNLEKMFTPVEIDGEDIEVGTDLVRVFTALYSGLPYDSPESEYMPASAVQVLVDAGKLDEAQQTYREKHTFDLLLLAEGAVVEDHVEAESEAEALIKGRTTMGELLEYGITKEQFKEIAGVDMPDGSVGLRDFASQNGLDMETVKTELEALLASATAEIAPTETTEPTEESAEPAETAVSPEPETAVEPSVETSVIDIKGSTSIDGVLAAGLTAEQFTEITGVAVPDDTTARLKDFVDANGLDMESVRTKILETLTPTTDASEPESPQVEETPDVEEPAQSDGQSEAVTPDIKGSTSVDGVLAAGLTVEQFTEITGVAVPDATTVRLKDFVDANGLDMESVRTQILDTLTQE